MSSHYCRHYYVSGRVQGVFYRASTQQQASALGLTGWVRNLHDGRVELVACGDMEVINKLEQWLQQGPDYAQVEAVQGQDVPSQSFTGFQVRY